MKKELLNVKVVGRGCDKYFELLGIVQKAFHNKKTDGYHRGSK